MKTDNVFTLDKKGDVFVLTQIVTLELSEDELVKQGMKHDQDIMQYRQQEMQLENSLAAKEQENALKTIREQKEKLSGLQENIGPYVEEILKKKYIVWKKAIREEKKRLKYNPRGTEDGKIRKRSEIVTRVISKAGIPINHPWVRENIMNKFDSI